MIDKKISRLTALIEMSSLITSSLETGRIMKCAIEVATNLLGAEAGSVLLFDQDHGELVFDVVLGEKGNILKKLKLPRGCGIAGWVADHGIPQLVANAVDDVRFYEGLDDLCGFATREIACVPIRVKEKMFGVLEAINKLDGTFDNDDLEILQALGNQVAVALENARLYQENRRQCEEILATEKRYQWEKEKLLKDLHDGIGGLTTNINLLSELGKKMDAAAEMNKIFSTIAELSREGMEEIRTFMDILEGQDSPWSDLAAELRRHGHCMTEAHQIDFTFSVDGVEACDRTPGVFLYRSLFRIFKEALVNVIKHSQATSVAAALTISPALVRLTIHDNGLGITEVVRAGRGIANMQTRAQDLGGELRISGSGGTLVFLEVPLRYPLWWHAGQVTETATEVGMI